MLELNRPSSLLHLRFQCSTVRDLQENGEQHEPMNNNNNRRRRRKKNKAISLKINGLGRGEHHTKQRVEVFSSKESLLLFWIFTGLKTTIYFFFLEENDTSAGMLAWDIFPGRDMSEFTLPKLTVTLDFENRN